MRSYADYVAAIEDPAIEAVVVAVPPRFHLDLTLRALEAGKHVLVEKPAYLAMAEYQAALEAGRRVNRVVLVGENDHYKPLAASLRRLLARHAIGPMVFAHFASVARRLKTADDWRNDETMAGGDAFFEEGIHWLHLAGSLGPRITSVHGYRPAVPRSGPDRRDKSMMVAFRYDTGAVGALVLLEGDSVAAEGTESLEAVRAGGCDYVRVKWAVRAGAGAGDAAAAAARLP